jgi:hypothetical protein
VFFYPLVERSLIRLLKVLLSASYALEAIILISSRPATISARFLHTFTIALFIQLFSLSFRSTTATVLRVPASPVPTSRRTSPCAPTAFFSAATESASVSHSSATETRETARTARTSPPAPSTRTLTRRQSAISVSAFYPTASAQLTEQKFQVSNKLLEAVTNITLFCTVRTLSLACFF